jgi:hypothetical protein
LYRILRPNGWLRIINEDANVVTNSPAMHEYHLRGSLALQRAGSAFYADQLGISPRLRFFFEQAGFLVRSQRYSPVDISAGTEAYKMALEDYKILLGNLRPFLVKWGTATETEADDLYHQFLREMRSGIDHGAVRESFTGFWHFFSILGQKVESHL